MTSNIILNEGFKFSHLTINDICCIKGGDESFKNWLDYNRYIKNYSKLLEGFKLARTLDYYEFNYNRKIKKDEKDFSNITLKDCNDHNILIGSKLYDDYQWENIQFK